MKVVSSGFLFLNLWSQHVQGTANYLWTGSEWILEESDSGDWEASAEGSGDLSNNYDDEDLAFGETPNYGFN